MHQPNPNDGFKLPKEKGVSNPPPVVHLYVDDGKLMGNIEQVRSDTLYALGEQHLIHFNDGANGGSSYYQLYCKADHAQTSLQIQKAAEISTEAFADRFTNLLNDYGRSLSPATEADRNLVMQHLESINSDIANTYLQSLRQEQKLPLHQDVIVHLKRYGSEGDLEITPFVKMVDFEEKAVTHMSGKTKWIVGGGIAAAAVAVGAFTMLKKKPHAEQEKERAQNAAALTPSP